MRPAVLALLALVSSVSHARWLPKSEAGTVFEKLHVGFDVVKDGGVTQTVEYLIRVQSEDAKPSASRIEIEYNAATDQVEILEAVTLNG
ncbi:MAG TPA: DUF3857 domain-containing protein, partial [Bdellovibrionales bacterium]|nr:DUF3857 domain-containing protein [Bdellovibrionales bacterium]